LVENYYFRHGSAARGGQNSINMSEHQKDTEFLRRIMVYDASEEHRALEKRIAQVQCDEHCVKRVALAAVLFALAAIAGLTYVAILEENFPYNQSQLVVTVFCDLGLASLICLMGFTALLLAYRKGLNRLREECRRLVTKHFESHVGKSPAATLTILGSPGGPGSLPERAVDDENNRPNHLSAA